MYTYDETIQQRILALLQMPEEDYHELVLDQGIAYVKKLVGEYPAVEKQIVSSNIFWRWWRQHWQDRDLQYLEECETWHTTVEKYRLVYANHNDGATLAAALYLNGQVLEQSYAALMQTIIDNQTKKEPV